MEDLDEQIDTLEAEFLSNSGQAFAQAEEEAHRHGFTVLFSKNGQLFRRSPNGDEVLVKEIDPPLEVKAGEIIALR